MEPRARIAPERVARLLLEDREFFDYVRTTWALERIDRQARRHNAEYYADSAHGHPSDHSDGHEESGEVPELWEGELELKPPPLPAEVIGSASQIGTVPADRQVFAFLLLWLVALTVPVVQPYLAKDVQEMLTNYYASVALALEVHWHMRDKHRDYSSGRHRTR